MRGRINAVTAGVLTAELRKRPAGTHNTDRTDAQPRANEAGGALGSRAVRLAQLAVAVHMTAAATRRAST